MANSSRDALFGPGSSNSSHNAGAVRSGWATIEDDDDSETEQTRGYSVPQLKQHQYQIIKDQDRGLEALSEVISRQKHIAQTIGSEVDYQNELIEDITDHVDRTRDRLIGETTRVRTIDRKDATCGYWIVIIILLVIIIVLASL